MGTAAAEGRGAAVRGRRTVVLAVVRGLAAAALGVAVGFAVWFAAMMVLGVAGFYTYAVILSPWVGLALTLAVSPVLYLRARRRHPARASYLLLALGAAAALLLTTGIDIGRT